MKRCCFTKRLRGEKLLNSFNLFTHSYRTSKRDKDKIVPHQGWGLKTIIMTLRKNNTIKIKNSHLHNIITIPVITSTVTIAIIILIIEIILESLNSLREGKPWNPFHFGENKSTIGSMFIWGTPKLPPKHEVKKIFLKVSLYPPSLWSWRGYRVGRDTGP